MPPYCWLSPEADNAHLPVCAPLQFFRLGHRFPEAES